MDQIIGIELFGQMEVGWCTAIAEKCFIGLWAIHREGFMFGAIGSKTATVFVAVLILGFLTLIPNAIVAISLLGYDLCSS